MDYETVGSFASGSIICVEAQRLRSESRNGANDLVDLLLTTRRDVASQAVSTLAPRRRRPGVRRLCVGSVSWPAVMSSPWLQDRAGIAQLAAPLDSTIIQGCGAIGVLDCRLARQASPRQVSLAPTSAPFERCWAPGASHDGGRFSWAQPCATRGEVGRPWPSAWFSPAVC